MDNRNTIRFYFALLKRELYNALRSVTVKVDIQHIKALTTPLMRSVRSLNRINETTQQGVKSTDSVREEIVISRDRHDAFTKDFEKKTNTMIASLQDHTDWLEELSDVVRTVKVENLRDIDFEQLDDLVEQSAKGLKKSDDILKVFNSYLTLSQSMSKTLERISQKEVVFPKVQKIEGSTSVTSLPKITELEKAVQTLHNIQDVLEIQVRLIQDRSSGKKDSTEKLFSALSEKLDTVSENIQNIRIPEVEFPETINVGNFPPQKYPLPPTHISINALGGFVKSRSVTVSTSLTPLPGEVLSNRRSMIIYNNSSSTVEIGGSTFSFGDGLPVPGGTFSPPLDVGDKMIVYGRVETGTADVRTLEVSDINIGR